MVIQKASGASTNTCVVAQAVAITEAQATLATVK